MDTHRTVTGAKMQRDTSTVLAHAALGEDVVLIAPDKAYAERVYENAKATMDRMVAPVLEDTRNITVKHTRAQIAGNPKDFPVEVLVVELRAIAGQQIQVGTTNKLRTHFDKISGELRRRGLDNNGEPLDG